jgi:hypothetical protein
MGRYRVHETDVQPGSLAPADAPGAGTQGPDVARSRQEFDVTKKIHEGASARARGVDRPLPHRREEEELPRQEADVEYRS